MPLYARALVDFGHLLGVVMGIGGLLYQALVLIPASQSLDASVRATLVDAMRARARRVVSIAIVLILGTGLLKWMPASGGVGWLGGGGYRTAMLHGKIVLALAVFHLAFSATRAAEAGHASARTTKVRLAAGLGVAVMLLAVAHRSGL